MCCVKLDDFEFDARHVGSSMLFYIVPDVFC